MNQLISIRTNIIYTKNKKEKIEDEDVFLKHHELIFLVDKAKYNRTDSGEIVRERAIEELRFTVAEDSFEMLVKILLHMQSADESQLI